MMICVWKFFRPADSGGYGGGGARSQKNELIVKLENLPPAKPNDLQWAAGAKMKLLSAHDNGYVGVWSAEAPGSLLKTIKLHTGPVASLCITSDSKTMLTASHDRSGKAVDISSPETPILARYEANRPLNAVTMSDDYKAGETGVVVLGGGRDPMVVTQSNLLEDEFQAKVLDSASSSVLAAGQGHFGPVHAARFMSWIGPRGAFATAAEDGCLRVHGVDGSLLHSDTLQ
jgi:WD40 repeat protein